MKPHPGLLVLLSVLLGPAAAMAARFNVKSYGAIGDGSANDTRALQATIDAAGEAGGGEVYFPDGTYRTVRLNLRSHLVVNLSPGAILQASPVAADWSECNLGTVLGARGVDHLTLEGGGTVDGAGFAFYDGAGQFTLGNRPQTIININDSTNVVIRHLTLRNSVRWTLVLNKVEHSIVDGVKIRNREYGLSRETDGIDLSSCRHALVQHCDIETGDDGICIKPQDQLHAYDMYDILVQDCTVATTCNAVKIGTGTSNNLYDMRCRNITVNRHSQIHSNGNPVKTDHYGSENGSCISAIAVESNDGGAVHDLVYENFTINDCDTPIYVEVENRQTYAKHPTIGSVYNLTFSHLTCRASARASQVNDQAPGNFRNLTFDNLEIHNRETYDGNASPLHLAGAYPDAQKLGRLPAYGLFARDVTGLNFKGKVIFHDDGHSGRPVLATENVTVTGSLSQ